MLGAIRPRAMQELTALLAAGRARIALATALQLAWQLAVPLAVYALGTDVPWLLPLGAGFVVELVRIPLEQRLRRDLRRTSMRRAAQRAFGSPPELSEARIDATFWGAYIAEAAVSFAVPGALAAGLAALTTLLLSALRLGPAVVGPIAVLLVAAAATRFLLQKRLSPLAEAVVARRGGASTWLAAVLRDHGELSTDASRASTLAHVDAATAAWCDAEDSSDRARAVGRWMTGAAVLTLIAAWLAARGLLEPSLLLSLDAVPGRIVAGGTLFALALPAARRCAAHLDSVAAFAAELGALAPEAARPRGTERLAGRASRLEARGLVLAYGEHVALRVPSLRLALDGIVGVRGANGAGKSSFAAALAGTLAPREGSLTVDGLEATSIAPEDVALVPQEPVLIETLSLRENVRLVVPSADDAASARVLARLGLTRSLDDAAGGLSRGERQRIALARALLRAPRLLVLDEPDAWLDEATRARLADVLDEASAASAIIVVTHREELLGRCRSVLEARGEAGLALVEPAPGLARER